MAWSGYFMFGGTEVINATRTEAYARHLGVGWFRPVYRQDALSWLLGEKPYTTPLQDDAPWTDPDNLDSYDFYGVYPLEVTGVEDGTVDATVVESVSDGGYIGRTRKKTRTVVFSTVLAGASECAVEYGMRWLRSVLTGGACFNQSYGVCGGADLCYLACPPLMDVEDSPPPKPAVLPEVVATNWAANPNLESDSTGWNSSDPSKYPVARSTVTPITGTASAVTTRQGVLDATIGSVYIGDQAGARLPVTAGEQVTVGMDIKVENPSVVDATNLTFNPIGPGTATTAGNHWVPTRGTLSAVADSLRLTITDAQLAANAQRIQSPQSYASTGSIKVTPGQMIRAVGQVRSSGSFPMAVIIQTYDVNNTFLTQVTGVPKTTNPSTWTEVDASMVIPAGAAAYVNVQFGIHNATAPRNVGDTIDLQRAYVGNEGASVPWFDGSTATSGDYTYRWTGAVNASTSERVRANPPVKTVNRTNLADNPNVEGDVSGWTSNTPANYPITQDTSAPISGTTSAMSTRTATSPNNYAFAGILKRRDNSRFPCTAGAPVTFGIDVKLDQAGRNFRTNITPYDAGGSAMATLGWVITPVATPNQVTRFVRTFTPPAGAVGFYINVEVNTTLGGNAVTGERCWLDNLMVENGTTDGSYLDGSTPASGGNLYRWTGAVNASTSERYAETPIRRLVQAQVGFNAGDTLSVTVNNVQPGVVTRAVVTGTVPVGATGMYAVGTAYRMSGSGNAVTGERVWFDNLTIEQGTTDGSYFDGSTPDDDAFDYRWRGPANASVSERWTHGYFPPVGRPDESTESAYQCYTRVGRSLHEVTTTVGPTVTNKLEMTDGGCAWQVTWTMVAANPAEFGVEKPLVVGFLDPNVDIPYFGGVVPEGGSFDENGNVQSDPSCPVTVYRPVYDPTCTLLAPPPDVPEIFPTCFSFPVNFLRTMFTIPRQEIPLWTHVTPVISLTTGTVEARSVRVRFYADMFDTGDPSSDPCNFCGDVVFSYIPPQSTITLDCADHEVYIDQPGIGRRRADSLVSDSSGNPFEWPEFSCGFGYVVTVDMPQQMTKRPVLDLSLVPRMV